MVPTPLSRRALAAALLCLLSACAEGAAPPPAAPVAPPPASVPAADPTRAVVEGVVRGPDGAPVDGALVAVVPMEGASREAASMVSEGGGRFRFAGLPPGKYAITATTRGLAAAYVDVFTAAAGPPGAPVEAKLGGPALVVRGVVLGAQGEPLAGTTMRFSRVSEVEGDLFLARTDARGAYEVALPRAPYGVHVEAPGLECPDQLLDGAADATLDVTLTRAFPLDAPPPAEVKAWLQQAAVPLATVEAEQGFADLKRVGAMVGPARVVALGEATHGTREFFQLKHRMLEYLVTELGFTAFAMEASFAEALAVDAYVRTGKGDPAEAVARMRIWPWDTEEVLALVRWMRRYNEDARHPRKLRFYGFDMQYPPESAQALVAYLHRVDPGAEAEARRAVALLDDDFTVESYPYLPAAAREATRAGIAALAARLEQSKDAYVKRGGAEAFALARLHAAVLGQGERQRASLTDYASRDRAMADNARALLDLEGPSGKLVLWAHNGHVSRAHLTGRFPTMGWYLDQALHDQMVTFGFAFAEGSFQARGVPFTDGSGPVDFTVPLAPPGSLDGALASLGHPVLALDLRPAPRHGPVADWLGAWLWSREIGAGYSEQIAVEQRAPASPRATWDAMLFVEKTTAAHPNPGARHPPRAPAPKEPALRNAGLEDGPPDVAPAGWQGSPPNGRAPYRVLASTEHPKEGKRCAMIAREKAPWPWGEGELSQKIDAAPFRGKRVRLRAAMRAEVQGTGHEAHLFLRVMGRGDQVLTLGSTFDRPIVDKAWRSYEVEADVPVAAESLILGAALAGNGRAFVDEVSLAVVGEGR